ncbi:MAG: MaoC/PaaZ C-terminal domain-containing protein [Pseudomonadota bacterium]|nr:MaoC/PaaZ C-terminal domain-containing protein [Pseudomonadota bacterium]
MSAAANLQFDAPPSVWVSFAKAAKPGAVRLAPGQDIPRLEAHLAPAPASARQVAKYRKLCGFESNGLLPATYPHIMAAPLHMAVLTHEAFPLRLLGAVHMRNVVHQHRALHQNEPLGVHVVVEGHRPVDKGLEFDLQTRIVDTDEQCVWESISTNLIRDPGKKSSTGGGKKGWEPPVWDEYSVVDRWKAASNIGRRYGVVAGDVNPIHMHAVAAKLFGFKRAIAHGMWSFASAVARCGGDMVEGACTLDVAFKRPLFLPGQPELLAKPAEGGQSYLMTNPGRSTVYLDGSTTPVG